MLIKRIKNEKFTLNAQPKFFFRQINSLVIYLVNVLLSRNFWHKSARVNFGNFHTLFLMHFYSLEDVKILHMELFIWFHGKNIESFLFCRNNIFRENMISRFFIFLFQETVLGSWTLKRKAF